MIPGTAIPQGQASARRGDWFLTSTGKKFYPTDPRPEEVCIEDIAHALSHVCRFGGHCIDFYSVAQHSVMVSEIVSEKNRLLGLMHDATEAYIGDMVRPLKYQMPQYRAVEDALWVCICSRFGFAPDLDPEIKVADNVALMTERRDIVVASNYPWSIKEKPLERTIDPWPPRLAKRIFLERYFELGGRV